MLGGCEMKTQVKKVVKVKVIGKQRLVGVIKYVKGKEKLARIENRVLGLVGKLKRYKNVVGALPIKSSSQVIPILQLLVLGHLVKGKKILVQKVCKDILGITRDNFSLRLINTFKALNKEKISALKVEKKNCRFVENSKNRITEFALS